MLIGRRHLQQSDGRRVLPRESDEDPRSHCIFRGEIDLRRRNSILICFGIVEEVLVVITNSDESIASEGEMFEKEVAACAGLRHIVWVRAPWIQGVCVESVKIIGKNQDSARGIVVLSRIDAPFDCPMVDILTCGEGESIGAAHLVAISQVGDVRADGYDVGRIATKLLGKADLQFSSRPFKFKGSQRR